MALLIDEANKQPTQQIRQGTGFTNVARVLNANRSAAVGSALAQNIAQKAQQVGSGIEQAKQQTQAEITAQAIDPTKYSGVFQQGPGGQTTLANRDLTQAEKGELAKTSQFDYKERGIQNEAALGQRAQKLKEYGQGQNVQNLAQSTFGVGRQYGRGMSQMDTMLAGQKAPEVQNLATSAQKSLQDLAQAKVNLAQQNLQTKTSGETAKKQLMGLAQSAADTFKQQQESLKGSLQEKLGRLATGETPQFSQEEKQAMGLTPEKLASGVAIDPNAILQQLTTQQVVDPTSYGRLMNLASTIKADKLTTDLSNLAPQAGALTGLITSQTEAFKRMIPQLQPAYEKLAQAGQLVQDAQRAKDNLAKQNSLVQKYVSELQNAQDKGAALSPARIDMFYNALMKFPGMDPNKVRASLYAADPSFAAALAPSPSQLQALNQQTQEAEQAEAAARASFQTVIQPTSPYKQLSQIWGGLTEPSTTSSVPIIDPTLGADGNYLINQAPPNINPGKGPEDDEAYVDWANTTIQSLIPQRDKTTQQISTLQDAVSRLADLDNNPQNLYQIVADLEQQGLPVIWDQPNGDTPARPNLQATLEHHQELYQIQDANLRTIQTQMTLAQQRLGSKGGKLSNDNPQLGAKPPSNVVPPVMQTGDTSHGTLSGLAPEKESGIKNTMDTIRSTLANNVNGQGDPDPQPFTRAGVTAMLRDNYGFSDPEIEQYLATYPMEFAPEPQAYNPPPAYIPPPEPSYIPPPEAPPVETVAPPSSGYDPSEWWNE